MEFSLTVADGDNGRVYSDITAQIEGAYVTVAFDPADNYVECINNIATFVNQYLNTFVRNNDEVTNLENEILENAEMANEEADYDDGYMTEEEFEDYWGQLIQDIDDGRYDIDFFYSFE